MSGDNRYIRINLMDWDNTKVSIGKAPPSTKPGAYDDKITVLYDGKLPILTIIDTKPEQGSSPYLLTSYAGLQKSMEYNSQSKKYTDVWKGEWGLNVQVCRSIKDANAGQRKLMDVMNYIVKFAKEGGMDKMEPAFTTKKVQKMVFGTLKDTDEIDVTKPCSMNISVSYTADKDCEKFMDAKLGKEVPVFEARRPNPPFYDVTRALNDNLITNWEDANRGMACAPSGLLTFSHAAGKDYLKLRLYECYYQPKEFGGNKNVPNQDMLNLLRSHQGNTACDNNAPLDPEYE